jgi:hypothetical protein
MALIECGKNGRNVTRFVSCRFTLKKHLFYKRLHVQDSIVLSNIKLPVCKNNSFQYVRRISYSTIIISFYLRDLAVPSFYVAEISP